MHFDLRVFVVEQQVVVVLGLGLVAVVVVVELLEAMIEVLME